MNRRIDINVDIGEGFGFDRDLLQIATSANIACGVHAGSLETTMEAVELCLERGVRVGVHPGYPDRQSMGRAAIPEGMQVAYLDSIRTQIEDFLRRTAAAYVKPHGAFYNDLARPLSLLWDSVASHPGSKSPYEAGGQELSKAPGSGLLIMLLRINHLPLMGLPGTLHQVVADRAGYGFIREGFADRRTTPKGLLVPRSEPGAVLSDLGEITQQVFTLAEKVDSICIHGDTEGAVAIAERVRRSLEKGGYEVAAE